MNKFMKRVKSKAGETLIETMGAILIFTFASIIMYNMVTSSAEINRNAKEVEESYREQINILEQGTGTGKQSSIALSYKKKDGTVLGNDTVNVTVYTAKENGPLYTYFPRPEQETQEVETP